MPRRALLLPAVVALAAILAPASAAYTGRVSHAEYRATVLGTPRWKVQHAWAATGTRMDAWDAHGTSWRKVRYRTTLGAGTRVEATYRLNLTNGRWRLRDKEFCTILDSARTPDGGPAFGTWACRSGWMQW